MKEGKKDDLTLPLSYNIRRGNLFSPPTGGELERGSRKTPSLILLHIGEGNKYETQTAKIFSSNIKINNRQSTGAA